MKNFRYIDGVSSLSLDRSVCIGCKMCSQVCPQAVFSYHAGKASIEDGDGCMECGACGLNCPVGAVSVNPGVG